MPRMNIFDKSSFYAFNKPPEFNSLQRKSCFDFSGKLIESTMKLRSPCKQIGFLLNWGYFKITKRFFGSKDFYIRDIAYVARILGYDEHYFQPTDYPLRTRQRHYLMIIKLFGFRQFDAGYEKKINAEIAAMVKQHLKPNLIFWRCTDIMISDKISFPTYYRIRDLILSSISKYKSEMTSIIKQKLSEEGRILLNSLFDQKPESNVLRLTVLKKQSQSTAPIRIKDKLADFALLTKSHNQIKPILAQLELTEEGIRYFAASVIKTKTSHLLRKDQADADLHLIAFICHQYYRLQDNLTDVFLGVVKNIENTAYRIHRDWCYENRNTSNEIIVDKVDQLKLNVFGIFEAIRITINNRSLSEKEKINHIGRLVSIEEDANAITLNKFNEVKECLSGSSNDKSNYYNILEKRSLRLQNRVNGILKSLDFRNDEKSDSLIQAINNFIQKDGAISSSAPIDFLNNEEKKHLIGGDRFRISLYKVFLFQYVAKAIKSGSLNLKHSYKYRSLDSYLINKQRWQVDREELLERADMIKFSNTKLILEDLDQKLLKQFKITNSNISCRQNPYVKLTKNDHFIVNTPKQEEHTTEALSPFFPMKHLIPLTEILATVNHQTNFTSELQHWQQQYNRGKSVSSLLAGVIGLGCAIGIRKMARISNQIGEDELENVVNWHFSLENIRAANDCVLNHIDNMELPNIYRKSTERTHTASDGQKFEVNTDSLNANYSFKYFGKGQGVSAYTFVDERSLLWHSLVFSAAERESAYVIDGLMRNDVIKSDIHSTDTHGYSEVVFAITYLLGFSFAPRIKNIKKQTLYIFKSGYKGGKDWIIKPSKIIDVALIEEYWDEILRLVATIKLKENTASNIFKRLNSYSKQHKLYAALKAFGRIIKSHFILCYIDDVELRQSIEKLLNKIELANRFTRDVAVGNPRNFVDGDKEDQEIAETCNRLIKNSIICWNYMFLEKELEKSDSYKREKLMTSIKTHSPMTWAHINMLGEYDFSDKKMQDSCGILPTKIVT